ncbi:MAG: rod shape-determining protein RodA [Synergistaceae bacterium]|nr:rod shape-determining protein RodA [Synergistaceae bacterium]
MENRVGLLDGNRIFLDRSLLVCAFVLVLWGVFSIYSAGAGSEGMGWSLALRQAGWAAAGGCALFLTLALGHQRLLDATYPLFAFTLLLLLATPFLAPRVKGAQSWIPIGGFRFQPSEFAKLSLILMMSKVLSRYPPITIKAFAGGLFVMALPVLLVLLQPDAGSALVYVVIAFGMLFVAGAPLRYLGGLIGSGLAALPFVVLFGLKEYQRMRLLVFIDPMRDPLGAGYNVIQSRIAVGSGGFWGKGFMQGLQSKLRFLPEPHTDFIFSVYSEEFGFLGDCLLLLLFAFLFWRIAGAGLRSRDRRGKILVAGVSVWIWFQMFESMGMSIGLMPVTGLPLPFLSYGGSSLIAIAIALGLVGSVYLEGVQRPYF